jgi:hypothetical protein
MERNGLARIVGPMTHAPFHPFDPPQFLRHERSPERRGRSAGAVQPVKSKGDYIARCPVCGQAYDLRELDEVLHHAAGLHEPLSTN